MILAPLVARSVARSRGTLAGVAALLAAFQVALVLLGSSYDEQRTFETLGRMIPGFIQRWLGEGLFVLGSFKGIVAVGYFHPVVVLVMSMVSAYLASDPAADVEDRYVDLLLARPVGRHWLVTRSAVLLLACPATLAVVMMAASWTAMTLAGPAPARWPSITTIATLSAHLVLMAASVGAFALLLAAGARRRAAAFAPAAIVVVALDFTNVLAASWRPAQWLDVFSPFHYYQGAKILAGLTDPPRDLLVLGAAAAVLVAAGYWRFSLRDL